MNKSLIYNLLYFIRQIHKGGNIYISCYKQANGDYVTISGLGVQAGGYKNFEEALEAWRDAKEAAESRGE